jgi:hypothetical protein
VGRGTPVNVIFEILGALVVVLLHSPSSICMFFLQWSRSDHRYPWRTYLGTATNKRAIRPLDLEKTANREATRHKKNNYIERMQKEERLSPLGGCPIPGSKNRSGDLLSTSLSLSLASTSWVDRVNLYGLNGKGIGPSSS